MKLDDVRPPRQHRDGKFLAACLVSLVTGLSPAHGQSVTFTNSTTIAATNTAYDGYEITVEACTVTVNGPHAFGNVSVTSAGTWRCSDATITNDSRTITADGGTVELVHSTVSGGTLRVTDNASSFVQFSGDVTLTGVVWDDSGAGEFRVFQTTARLLGDYADHLPAGNTLVVQSMGYMGGSAQLTLAGGEFTNDGTIEIRNGTDYYPSHGKLYLETPTTLTGTGQVVLTCEYSADNPSITGPAGVTLTVGKAQRVHGLGTIEVPVINHGAVEADISDRTLTLAGGLQNSGTVRALTNGMLRLPEGTVTNADSLIVAEGGSVRLLNTALHGGTIRVTDDPASFIEFSGDVALPGVTWEDEGAGEFRVWNATARLLETGIPVGQRLVVGEVAYTPTALAIPAGVFTNAGTIELRNRGSTYGQAATLRIEGTVTLAGDGEVLMRQHVLEWGDMPAITGTNGAVLTVTSDQRIRGLGAVSVPVVSHGVIEAAGAGGALTFYDTVSGPGVLRALTRGTLRFSGALVSGGDPLIVADGGTVDLVNSTFNGGTLRAMNVSNSLVRFSGDVTLNGVTWEDDGLGEFQVKGTTARLLGNTMIPEGQRLVVSVGAEVILPESVFTNHGIIELKGSAYYPKDEYARLKWESAATLTGSGRVELAYGEMQGGIAGMSECLPYRADDYRYYVFASTISPPSGFEQPGFDDSGWSTGSAAFGSGGSGSFQTNVQTHWPARSDLVLRRWISVPAPATEVYLMAAVENDIIAAFVNGVKVSGRLESSNPWSVNHFCVYVTPALFHPGTNLVTFHVRNRGVSGESFCDTRVVWHDRPRLTIARSQSIVGNGQLDLSILNLGLLEADQSGRTLRLGRAMINEGSLSVLSGAILDLDESCRVDGVGVLAGQAGGTIAISTNLLGNTTNLSAYAPNAQVKFDGSGTAVSPQLLEVMGHDFGAEPEGFAGNFAYSSLALTSNVYVRLVDLSDNVPGMESEALYVTALALPAGATLDLNGLHLYVRAAQIAGTVVGGSILQVPDSGPITYGTGTPGTIGMPGETDQWTFFGRAGRAVAVVVNPGATGTPAPSPPYLAYARVELVSPDEVLLAATNNTVWGRAVQLIDVPLPADGVYSVNVKAAPGYPVSTGNYVITVWDMTPDIQPLVLNRQVNGRIETPYSVDRWQFSCLAGHQVRFDLVSRSNPSIVFDLTGPGDWTGFSDLGADSDLISLPHSGAYTLTAHGTGGQYGGAYACRLLETVQTNLALGTVYHGTFAGSGQAQIFRVGVPTSMPMRVLLTDTDAAHRHAVYVKLGAPPTRGDYDFASEGTGTIQSITVPLAAAAAWYVLVYADHIPDPGDYTLAVSTAGLLLDSVSPSRHAATADTVLTLTGAGFEAGTQVELVGAGRYAAGEIAVDSFTRITATFPSNTVPAGLYSVRCQQDDGDEATLANALDMVADGLPKLVANLILPDRIRYDSPATFYIECANEGDAAMDAPLLVLSAAQNGREGALMSCDRRRAVAGFWTSATPRGFAARVQVLGGGLRVRRIEPGERRRIPVVYAGWAHPWDFTTPPIHFTLGVLTADNDAPADWASLKPEMRPSYVAPDAWDAVWENFVAAGRLNLG